MEIAYHIGAHHTDDGALLASILKNSDQLVAQNILVPEPEHYRDALHSAIFSIREGEEPDVVRSRIMDAALGGAEPSRLVLSYDQFFSGPRRVLENGGLYRLASQRAGMITRIFEPDTLELHLGIRNLATFIPEAFANSGLDDFPGFLSGLRLDEMAWVNVVRGLRAAAPTAQIHVWCNEDTPLLWSQLIRDVSGIHASATISGGFDLLEGIMTDEGMTRLMDYLKSHPPQTEVQKRRIIAAFLDKFVIAEALEEELDLPGWDEAMIDHLTEAYELDVAAIEEVPGVNFVAP